MAGREMSCGGTGGPPSFDTKMSDGRQFTDWTPRGALSERVLGVSRSKTQFPSSRDIKDALTRNAEGIRGGDRQRAAKQVDAKPCGLVDMPGFDSLQACDEFSCSLVPATPQYGTQNHNGAVGLGRR
jgi:hypothetical protein